MWGTDAERMRRVAEQIEAGMVYLNSAGGSQADLPFGGINNSGLGNAHGFYGFRAFSHERAVLEDKFNVVPMLFPPYTARVKQMIKWTVRFLS